MMGGKERRRYAMATCKSCGSSVPEGQNFCSMCYGDPSYGRDGYYEEYIRRMQKDDETEHEQQEKEVRDE